MPQLVSVTVLGLCALALVNAKAHAEDSAHYDAKSGSVIVGWDALEHAVDSGDAATTSRLATRIGLARISSFLGNSDEALRAPRRLRAVLTALTHVAGAERLLPWLLPLTRSEDGALGAAVVTTIGHCLRSTDGGRHALWDVPARVVSTACGTLATITRDERRPTPMRLAALAAHASAPLACPALPRSLLTASDAQIRRASVLATRAEPGLAEALTPLLDDADPLVVSAAAARLCQQTLAAAADGAPVQVPESVLLAARRFARASTASAADVVELLDCLARSPEAEDRALLAAVAEDAAGPTRARAQALLGERR